METLSHPAPANVPAPQISHVRSSSQTSSPATATRTTSMQAADAHRRSPLLSAPASQESFIGVRSAGSAPRLHTSSSNVSTSTDLTSPISAGPKTALEQGYPSARRDLGRERTPESRDVHVQREGEYGVGSPVSVASPNWTNGTKRTASGHVKNAPSLPNTPLTSTFPTARSRADSISSTSSRAGDLAATLKTRLGYAMAKVQNGWEHKNIDEVEHLAAYKPNVHRHRASYTDQSARPVSSGLTNGAARLSMYEPYGLSRLDGTTSPPSKRHSGTYASFVSSSQPILGSTPRLQPAPDIQPTTSHRHPHTAPSSQTAYSNVMSPPRTPVNGQHTRRPPPTLRTETQTAEAERDALQALFQLGSPHTSQHRRGASQASSSQASPLRAEFATPRRVTFARSESESSAVSSGSDDLGRGRRAGEQVVESS